MDCCHGLLSQVIAPLAALPLLAILSIEATYAKNPALDIAALAAQPSRLLLTSKLPLAPVNVFNYITHFLDILANIVFALSRTLYSLADSSIDKLTF